MELDSAVFLLFLGCSAGIHALLPGSRRVLALLGASLAFYAASSVPYLVLMVGLTSLNYAAVLGLSRNSDSRNRTPIFVGTVTVDLIALILFKYLAWNIGHILSICGWPGPGTETWHLAVPLGMSYFTFQMIACVTDAYRASWQSPGSFVEFLLFALFFPQISSGPIPRAGRLMPQLAAGGFPSPEDRLAGLRMITYGLFKKYVVANRLNEYVATVFDAPQALGTLPVLWAILFNMLFLYADFSGYVDIAIGSARFLGIRLDPNFDRPLTSTSVTELWRRWHMTLSFWLRDYLYMPMFIRIRALGRAGAVTALLVTFCICGIWHGFTLNFFLFGLTQGMAMSVEFLTKSWRMKLFKDVPKRLVASAGNIYTLGFFSLCQVLFRTSNLQQTSAILSRLVPVRLSGFFGTSYTVRPYFTALDFFAIGLWAATAFFFHRTSNRLTPWFVFLCAVLILLLGHLGTAHFIYAAF